MMISPLIPAACLILAASITVTTQMRLLRQQGDQALSALRNRDGGASPVSSVCLNLHEVRRHMLYMDELFHVPQVLRSVVGENYTYYDPMLTTPPGAYLAPGIALHVLKRQAPVPFAAPKCDGYGSFIEEEEILRRWAGGCASAIGTSAQNRNWLRLLYDMSCGVASPQWSGYGGAAPVGDEPAVVVEAAVSAYGTMVHILRLSGIALHTLTWILVLVFFVGRASAERKTLCFVVLSAMYPPLLLSSLLVYTDVASAASVAAVILLAPSGHDSSVGPARFGTLWARWCCVAVIGFFSISVRQSNVVWLFFVAAKFVIEGSAESVGRNTGERWHLCSVAVAQCSRLVFAASPCVVVALIFLEFVRQNGGIVLGDKSSHVAVFHPAQLVYLCATTAAFLPFQSLAAAMLQLRMRPWTTLSILLVGAVCGWYALTHHVWFHPYLVADNRHYTNVLYRKVLQDPYHRVAILVPLALAGLMFFVGLVFPIDESHQKGHPPRRTARASMGTALVAVLYFLCVALVVVPQRLIEFRYFAPVIAVGLLSFGGQVVAASRPGKHVLDMLVAHAALLDVVMALLIHAATCYIFTERTFIAPDGSVGRFMW